MDDYVSRTVREHLFSTWRKQRGGWEPLNIVRAEGVYFYDSQGRKYLDFSSQFVNVNLGYGNENVINAIKKQLETLQYISPPSLPRRSRPRLPGHCSR
ncbi:aminotransferase class III-fold pyridoxal phosphate-dependent enzyme [Vulcanisaeta distributa]|uniref:aminotransferase class III-fold pyridoxal phosphate-dependent enzyme n=1 Tax=Vulcanisaeta distributa TaxID=164451 RepID=UPI000AA47AF2|nr:aminotransferase class III-fold pyridoxal phosphate-dependent enzyme [Vulcanisaeta distributa]